VNFGAGSFGSRNGFNFVAIFAADQNVEINVVKKQNVFFPRLKTA
jgi:hypothetical protein